MKNYIRTCLSLDKETMNKITDITKVLGINKSAAIKEAIKFLYNHFTTWGKDRNNL